MLPRWITFSNVATTMVLIAAAVTFLTPHSLVPGVDGCRYGLKPATRSTCLAGRTAGRVREIGALRAIKEVERDVGTDERFAGTCHFAMHRAAGIAKKSIGIDDYAAVARLRGDCAQGFRHGIVEQATRSGDVSAVRGAAGICRTLEQNSISGRNDCYHGLGHGLRQHEGNRSATETCAQAISTRIDRYGCLTGVYMEAARQHPRQKFAGGPGAACSMEPAGDASVACFEYLPQHLLDGYDMSPGKVSEVCVGAPRPLERRRCFSYFGQLYGKRALKACSPHQTALRVECAAAFMWKEVAVLKASRISSAARSCLAAFGTTDAACAAATGMVLAETPGQRNPVCEAEFQGEQAERCRQLAVNPRPPEELVFAEPLLA